MNICYGLPYDPNNAFNYQCQDGYFIPNLNDNILPLGYNPYATATQGELQSSETRMENIIQNEVHKAEEKMSTVTQNLENKVDEVTCSVSDRVNNVESETKEQLANMKNELANMKNEMEDLEKRAIPQTPAYTTTNGETVHYQEVNKTQQPIIVREFGHSEHKINTYPFKVEYEHTIDCIYVRCNNMTLTFNKDGITCSEFILIEVINNVMNIWPYEERIKKSLMTNGKTKMDGYVIKSIDRKDIKTDKQFRFKQWKCTNMNLSTIEIYGQSCRICFDDVLSPDVNIMVYGRRNGITTSNKEYDSFRIDLNEEVLLDMNGSLVNTINANLKGKSIIRNFNVKKSFRCEVHGLSSVGSFNKTDDCVVEINKDITNS
jgi:ElaB/YqjD/DUF883 family membrane-anchored ribosome-binding protein